MLDKGKRKMRDEEMDSPGLGMVDCGVRSSSSRRVDFPTSVERFRNDTDKVDKWRAALEKASSYSGLDSNTIRREPQLINEIVEAILKKLSCTSSFDIKGLAMAHKIVCRPNEYVSGRGRRLWRHQDIYALFKNNREIEEIYGIALDMSQIKEIYLKPDTFEKINNLKVLKIYNSTWNPIISKLHIHSGLGNLPEELMFFQWTGYPHKFIPLNSCASNIIHLDMYGSLVEQLWVGNQHLPNLRYIMLAGSKHLLSIPDLSMIPNLAHLDVSYCTSLTQVYSSGSHSNLKRLFVCGCEALRINFGGNINVERRSWRLCAINEFFILNPFQFSKVRMGILKSNSCSNTFSFQFNFVSIPLTDIPHSSESLDTDYDSDSEKLIDLHGILKSLLPNLKLLSLLDEPSSLKTFPDFLQFDLFLANNGIPEDCYSMLFAEVELPTEPLYTPSMNGTGYNELDWEDLIGTDENSMGQSCNCTLSTNLSDNLNWKSLTQLSLFRNAIVTAHYERTHSPSCLNSLLLSHYKRTKDVKLILSFDSEYPEGFSKISVDFADHDLLFSISLYADGWKSFHCGTALNQAIWMHFMLYLRRVLNMRPQRTGWKPMKAKL
ncbi:hypothetical protein L6164_001422 [Bauhinia variegata]|uniref:Uncharacterized protein n=1 Tax=Bauhinia variegata TaxID=167791 RepID=A0ACB9QAU8_BAUVA|nr:hypothetical protein L6164_001422 [Bauhinia variegata]